MIERKAGGEAEERGENHGLTSILWAEPTSRAGACRGWDSLLSLFQRSMKTLAALPLRVSSVEGGVWDPGPDALWKGRGQLEAWAALRSWVIREVRPLS